MMLTSHTKLLRVSKLTPRVSFLLSLKPSPGAGSSPAPPSSCPSPFLTFLTLPFPTPLASRTRASLSSDCWILVFLPLEDHITLPL